jgi:hypothetical protein
VGYSISLIDVEQYFLPMFFLNFFHLNTKGRNYRKSSGQHNDKVRRLWRTDAVVAGSRLNALHIAVGTVCTAETTEKRGE